jgi:hypothetical protein
MTPAGPLRQTTMTAAEKRSAPGPAISKSARPMTGEEYIDSIRDGREVYLYGDRITDVTTHPAFCNSVRMTARLYDALFRTTLDAGIASRKNGSFIGIMPSSTRPSTETARPTKSPTYLSTSKKNGITASSSAVRRLSPRARRSPI